MKKVLSVILVLSVLLMTLASCGGRDKVDLSEAKSLADISGSGATIAAQSGTFHLKALNEQLDGVTKKEYEDFTALLMALMSGSIDGYIAEEPTAFTASLKDDSITYLPLVNNKTGFAVTGDDTGIAVAFKKGYKARTDESDIRVQQEYDRRAESHPGTCLRQYRHIKRHADDCHGMRI